MILFTDKDKNISFRRPTYTILKVGVFTQI